MKELFENFRKRMDSEHNLVEALCLSDKDGVIWKKQYIPRRDRSIYSHSKSFTSLMVGIAIDEGKLDFGTRLVDVFKDEISDSDYNRLYEITLENLLTMSSGFGESYFMMDQRKEGMGYPDYLKFMFSRELKEKPGSKFCYSNGDTYLLGRMVEKVYGKRFVQLCYEKIFKPLEIGFPSWGTDPMGYCVCASDLHLNIEEMNRLGILFLNKGVYKGKRIISEEYVNLCSKAKIKTGADDYSYQFWITPQGEGYRADGAWGQLTYIWDKYGLVFSIQRPEDDNMQKTLDILKEEVLDKM